MIYDIAYYSKSICPVCESVDWEFAEYINCDIEIDAVCKICGLYRCGYHGWDRTTWQGDEMFDKSRLMKFQKITIGRRLK